VSAVVNLGDLKFNVDSSSVTTSGVSAGGYMAVQLHVAHSLVVKGSAAFAAGPWFCAEDSIALAEEKCMDTVLGTPNTRYLADLTVSEALLGTVDDPFLMHNHKVFIYSGKNDSVIDPTVVNELVNYYSFFVDKENILTNFDINAEHSMPTLHYGEACEVLGEPYIGDCAYDGAGAALQHLYGSGLAKVDALAANLYEFDQTPYYAGKMTSLDTIGYIYIPTACTTDGSSGSPVCKLHVSFHGCLQTRALIGDMYAMHAGFNEWAEANNIIVVYPYAISSTFAPENPNGCFDWWGYTDPLYAIKEGVQIKFAARLIEAVSGVGRRA
jgi:hypothetical protein